MYLNMIIIEILSGGIGFERKGEVQVHATKMIIEINPCIY